MTNKMELIGYVRADRKDKTVLQICILKESIMRAETITGKDGTEYLTLRMDMDKLQLISAGERETSAVISVIEEA